MHERLKNAANIFNLKLYAPDKVKVIIGCLNRNHIKQTTKTVFTKVIKITEKRNKDGFRSGIRIAAIGTTSLRYWRDAIVYA